MDSATFSNVDILPSLKRLLEAELRLLPSGQHGEDVPARCRSTLVLMPDLLAPAFGYCAYPLRVADHAGVTVGAGERLQSAVAAKLFARAEQVILLAYTIGVGLEGKVEAYRREGRRTDAIVLDFVGSLAVDALGLSAHHRVQQLAVERGLLASIPLNPGTSHWPIANMAVAVRLLPPSLALALGDDNMLRPAKSIVMAIALGKDVPTEGSSCDYCARPDLCHNAAQRLLARLAGQPTLARGL